jgi:hypothetical protein
VSTGCILAATGVASDETSIATDNVTAMAASAGNMSVCVHVRALSLMIDKRVIGDFRKLIYFN